MYIYCFNDLIKEKGREIVKTYVNNAELLH